MKKKRNNDLILNIIPSIYLTYLDLSNIDMLIYKLLHNQMNHPRNPNIHFFIIFILISLLITSNLPYISHLFLLLIAL